MTFSTDKIEPHQYFNSYVRIAADLGPRARVCELGVRNGESLRMWQALFPLAAEIVGVDMQHGRHLAGGTVQVLARCTTTRQLPSMLGGTFDLIVDDGCHHGEWCAARSPSCGPW